MTATTRRRKGLLRYTLIKRDRNSNGVAVLLNPLTEFPAHFTGLASRTGAPLLLVNHLGVIAIWRFIRATSSGSLFDKKSDI